MLGVCGRMVCQVLCLRGELSLAGAATSIIIVTTKVCLTRPNVCHDKHNFVATKVSLRQAYFCRDKHVFLSRQKYACRDKHVFLATHICPLTYEWEFRVLKCEFAYSDRLWLSRGNPVRLTRY